MNIETKFDLEDRVVIAPTSEFYEQDTDGEVGLIDRIRTLHGTSGGHGDGVFYLLKFEVPTVFHSIRWIDEDDLMTEGEYEQHRDQTYEDRVARSAA